MKTIIIGDVHGSFLQLTQLLDQVQLDCQRDRLIFLGDLMDRGPQSWEVFDLVRRLKLEMGERCMLIKGNHEQMMLEAEKDRMMMNLWYTNGGGRTVQSFKRHRDQVWNHSAWFRQMVLYVETEDFICVHGGIGPEGPEQTDEETFLWDRFILEGNYQGKLVIAGHTPLSTPVYMDGHGNTVPFDQGKQIPLPKTGYICLDTGCVFGYRLTALVVEDGMCRTEWTACGTDAQPGSGEWNLGQAGDIWEDEI